MNGRRFTAALLGGIIGATASLVGSVAVAGAASASPGPVVHVSTESAQIGELVQVTGEGWSPVGQTVQMELCGQDALNLSNDCDQADQYTAAIRAGGVFYGALTVRLPPSPCPCVVLVTNQGGVRGVDVPITIVGARTVAVPPQPAPAAPVKVSAKVLTPVSVASWFGGPKAVTLVVRVTNLSSIAYQSAALSVNVGKGPNPSGFVVGRPLAPLAIGATQVLRIPVTLPAFTFGGYSVRAQVITGQGQVATVVGTRSYPWGLFVAAALVLQAVLLVLRNRVRARLGRTTATEVPIGTEPDREGVTLPVPVIDLRTPSLSPADAPTAGTELPVGRESERETGTESVPVIDVRTPSPSAAGVWTATNRLALLFPEQSLTCSVEVSACPAIRVQKTTVRAWADFAASPWDAVHEGSSWGELATESSSTVLLLGETFSYRGRGLELELRVSAMGPELRLGDNCTVLPVRAEGFVSFGGERSPVDIESTLEQTWVIDSTEGIDSEDSEPSAGSLTYAHAVGGDSFYLLYGLRDEPVGWLVRDGLAATIVRAVRRVEERSGPYPRRVTVDLSDDLGRQAHASGTATNGMTYKENDDLVLECRTEWSLDGAPAVGEDRSKVDISTWRSATRAAGSGQLADASS